MKQETKGINVNTDGKLDPNKLAAVYAYLEARFGESDLFKSGSIYDHSKRITDPKEEWFGGCWSNGMNLFISNAKEFAGNYTFDKLYDFSQLEEYGDFLELTGIFDKKTTFKFKNGETAQLLKNGNWKIGCKELSKRTLLMYYNRFFNVMALLPTRVTIEDLDFFRNECDEFKKLVEEN